MELEIGKRYITVGGYTVTVLEAAQRGDVINPYNVKYGDFTYTYAGDGTFCGAEDDPDYHMHIIGEYTNNVYSFEEFKQRRNA